MKRCIWCKKENLTGGEWCSVICEDEHKTVANSYEVESK